MVARWEREMAAVEMEWGMMELDFQNQRGEVTKGASLCLRAVIR